MPEEGETPKRISRRTLLKAGGAAAAGLGIATIVKPDLLDKLISLGPKKPTTEPSKTQTPQKEKRTKEPKFIPNEDDKHCLQAAVKSVLDTVLNKDISWDEINRETGYKDGLYSWPSLTTIFINKYIPETKFESVWLDYEQFAKEGEAYLKKLWVGKPDWYNLQKQHSSEGFRKEQEEAKELIKQQLYVKNPIINPMTIGSMLQNNLLIALVDAGKLAEKTESLGHFVVVYGQDNENFILHDPGLPQHRAWQRDKNRFMEAFGDSLIVVPKQKAGQ